MKYLILNKFKKKFKEFCREDEKINFNSEYLGKEFIGLDIDTSLLNILHYNRKVEKSKLTNLILKKPTWRGFESFGYYPIGLIISDKGKFKTFDETKKYEFLQVVFYSSQLFLKNKIKLTDTIINLQFMESENDIKVSKQNYIKFFNENSFKLISQFNLELFVDIEKLKKDTGKTILTSELTLPYEEEVNVSKYYN